MAKYSSAYSNLVGRLSEVELIIGMASSVSNFKSPPSSLQETAALCRGGIVLLCSHLEGYVETLGEIGIQSIGTNRLPKTKMVDEFRYYLSRNLIEEIRRQPSPNVIASKILEFVDSDLTIWDSSLRFSSPLPVDSFIKSFRSPNHRNIIKFFNRFGFRQFNGELQTHLKSEYQACIAMVDHIVDQRNKIAHGDYTIAGSLGDLKNMHQYLKTYCRTTDKVVGDWFKNIGCPIRK